MRCGGMGETGKPAILRLVEKFGAVHSKRFRKSRFSSRNRSHSAKASASLALVVEDSFILMLRSALPPQRAVELLNRIEMRIDVGINAAFLRQFRKGC